MKPTTLCSLGGVAALLLVSCNHDSTAPSNPLGSCSAAPITTLAPGQFTIIDATLSTGCVRLPPSGPSGAEHLLVALATSTQIAPAGVQAPYSLNAGAPPAASAVAPAPAVVPAPGSTAMRFHEMLRQRGRELAQRSIGRRLSGPRPPASPPVLGSQRSFQVCGTPTCRTFVTVTATAKHVGPHGAVYLDNAAPANGYSQADIDQVGALFDSHMYAIDTTAFGREPDLDNNSVVIILLTGAVNRLSGNCNQTGSVILGFFFPDDLISGSPGSNSGEVFYSVVPDPTNPNCTIPRNFAFTFLGPTFLHEFQHMISFNRHVLLAGGNTEDNWLDEGLSRFAEELGGREIPDSLCSPPSCRSQFASGDVDNAFTYLDKTTLESSFLIEPNNVDGTLADNGANWLFIRWLADHFATDSIIATSLTRVLDGADSPGGRALTGGANVAAATSVTMPTLEEEWQMANYLARLPSFTEPTGRLRYKSWDFLTIFTVNFGAYPLVPDSTSTGGYSHAGTLRAGSGRHLLVGQSSSAGEVDVRLTRDGQHAVSASVVPRIGVVRLQ